VAHFHATRAAGAPTQSTNRIPVYVARYWVYSRSTSVRSDRSQLATIRVEIVPVSCNDSMSGRAFPATVTVTLNGRTFRGCGEALATPFQG